jgi:hypothetical protein
MFQPTLGTRETTTPEHICQLLKSSVNMTQFLQHLPPTAWICLCSKLVHVDRLEEVGAAIECYPRTSCSVEALDFMKDLHPWLLDDSPEQIRRANRDAREYWSRIGGPILVDIHHNGYQGICEDLRDGMDDFERIMGTCREGKSVVQYLTHTFRDNLYRNICFFLVRGNYGDLLTEILSTSTHSQLTDLNRNYHSPDRIRPRVRLMRFGFAQGVSRAIAITGSVLHVATVFDCREAMAVLLRSWRSVGLGVDPIDSNAETPLFLAAKLGHIEILKMLLHAGADMNASSGYRYLIKSGEQRSTDHYNGVTPISVACSRLFTSIVKALLEAHADPNAADSSVGRSSPMMACLEHGLGGDIVDDKTILPIVELLLKYKADVNGRPDTVGPHQAFRTSVFVAARDVRSDTLRFLLDNRACVNTRDDFGDGPLDIVRWVLPFSRRQDCILDTISTLIEYGAVIRPMGEDVTSEEDTQSEGAS